MGMAGNRMEFNSLMWLVMLTKLFGYFYCYFAQKMACTFPLSSLCNVEAYSI